MSQTAPMTDLGMIGLGRMGAAMVGRLRSAQHRCVVYDVDRSTTQRVADATGSVAAAGIADLVRSLEAPRAVWIMVPSAFVDSVIAELATELEPGDTVIDGGNSHYPDDIRRSEALSSAGLHYVDVGTSGGGFGGERGYCLMVGGEHEPVERLAPVFECLAPGLDAAPRTPGRSGDPTPEERGWLHCGPAGAGHFVKMVHNGIEYGLMAAYAEGLNILRHAGVGDADHAKDAETSPLEHPELYRYRLDLPAITELWRRGSVVSSWLLDLTAVGFAADGADLSGYSGRVSDSGEGRWTVHAAIDEGVPAHVLSAALYSRFASRGEADFGDRVLSMMRKQFGGHAEVHPEAAS